MMPTLKAESNWLAWCYPLVLSILAARNNWRIYKKPSQVACHIHLPGRLFSYDIRKIVLRDLCGRRMQECQSPWTNTCPFGSSAATAQSL
ncbi:hypothetical protein JB92DRAFT_1016092 [Gautieria morchelliformis]|nr:hypothetical protein JB92DRAFT_1016092 [Gautieria morchelliformis]